MIRIIYVLVGLFLVTHSSSAGSIQEIRLKYSLEKKELHVEIDHNSRDDREDRIRKLVVSLNQGAKEEYFYHRQTSRMMFEANLSIYAKPGDELSVTAYLSEGGVKAASMVIEQPVKESSK